MPSLIYHVRYFSGIVRIDHCLPAGLQYDSLAEVMAFLMILFSGVFILSLNCIQWAGVDKHDYLRVQTVILAITR